MKKVFFAVLAALALVTAPGVAMDRIQWYAGSNPPSPWQNQVERDMRIGFGQLAWDIFGSTNGWFHNLSISPVTGLFVTVGPSSGNTAGSLYQYLPEDPTGFGGYPSGVGALALPPDSTQVFLQGIALSNGSAIGPLNPPGTAGQSIDYLVECQVQIRDQNPQAISLVNGSGAISNVSVNRDRSFTVGCKSKAGAAATTGSQAVPSTDAGWVAVGFVAVPQGTSTISGGMITSYGTTQASTPFVLLNPTAAQPGSPNIGGVVTATGMKIAGTTASQNFVSSGNNLLIRDYNASGSVYITAADGSSNAHFPDGGGFVVDRGNVSLANPLSIANGGIGQSSLPIGTCLAWNGTAIINGGCSTTGGSGVSSATLPLTFSGGVMACATCIYLNPSAPQVGQVNLGTGTIIAGGFYVGGSTAAGGNITQVNGVDLLFRQYVGGGGFYFQDGSGANNWMSITNTQIVPNVPIASAVGHDNAVLTFPNQAGGTAKTAFLASSGTSVSGVGAQTLLISALGVVNALAIDAGGNAGFAGGMFSNGGGISKNGSVMAITPCGTCTGGGYVGNAANTTPILSWTDAGVFSAAQFNGSGAGLTGIAAGSVVGILGQANGGTGTNAPSAVAGTGVTIAGIFPNQTFSVDVNHRAVFGKGSCTYSSGASANNFCDVTLNQAMADTNYGCSVSPTVSGSAGNSVWNSTVAQSTSVVRVFFFTIDASNNTVRFGANQSTTAFISCSEQG